MEFSYRECTDPVPQNGGKYCEGQRAQYQSCNTEPCDNNEGENRHHNLHFSILILILHEFIFLILYISHSYADLLF